ncbi:hypothetical protein Dsin_025311 [Dipteronia sinensis]|uniref:Uncharacterized protein n=1 Tax=Dipteronia sinensis TaxID=43782 RepID=A0AAD9ZW59_9ROSI|nr:hypothetical protein Dsin_025311 [Dipteronia sinensis]
MDKALVYGTRDSGFDPQWSRSFLLHFWTPKTTPYVRNKNDAISNFESRLSPVACSLQLESEMETVVKILQPGPLGIIEHKFCTEEVHQANATVLRAVENWRRNATFEQGNEFLKDFIHK